MQVHCSLAPYLPWTTSVENTIRAVCNPVFIPSTPRRSRYCVESLQFHNSETFSSYCNNALLMYSTLQLSPWKYFLIRIQWRMNLETSSSWNRLHDPSIASTDSSYDSVSEVSLQRSARDETAFTLRVIDAQRISNSLHARWKLKTNIKDAACGLWIVEVDLIKSKFVSIYDHIEWNKKRTVIHRPSAHCKVPQFSAICPLTIPHKL